MGQKEIFELLKKGGKYNTRQIREALGVNQKSITVALIKLRNSAPINVERIKEGNQIRLYYSYGGENDGSSSASN